MPLSQKVIDALTTLECDPATELPTEADLRKRFKMQALKHHPDKNPDDVEGATARFRDTNDAMLLIAKEIKKANDSDYSDSDDSEAEYVWRSESVSEQVAQRRRTGMCKSPSIARLFASCKPH